MILRARWNGALPVANEYLMSQGPRARFAYRIVEVELAVATPIGSDLSKLKLTVDRVAARDVPPGAVVHPWKWDPRTKKTGSAWSAL